MKYSISVNELNGPRFSCLLKTVEAMYGVPAKRSKSDHLVPFPEAKLGGKLVKNLVFAVPPCIIERKIWMGGV